MMRISLIRSSTHSKALSLASQPQGEGATYGSPCGLRWGHSASAIIRPDAGARPSCRVPVFGAKRSTTLGC